MVSALIGSGASHPMTQPNVVGSGSWNTLRGEWHPPRQGIQNDMGQFVELDSHMPAGYVHGSLDKFEPDYQTSRKRYQDKMQTTRRWMTRERRGASYSGASKPHCNEYVRSMWCKKKKTRS